MKRNKNMLQQVLLCIILCAIFALPRMRAEVFAGDRTGTEDTVPGDGAFTAEDSLFREPGETEPGEMGAGEIQPGETELGETISEDAQGASMDGNALPEGGEGAAKEVAAEGGISLQGASEEDTLAEDAFTENAFEEAGSLPAENAFEDGNIIQEEGNDPSGNGDSLQEEGNNASGDGDALQEEGNGDPAEDPAEDTSLPETVDQNEENDKPEMTGSNEENDIPEMTDPNEEKDIPEMTGPNEENDIPEMTDPGEEDPVPGTDLPASSSAAADLCPKPRELTYNGQAQELIDVEDIPEGALCYSLDGGTFSSEIPTGTDAGEYTVFFRAAADETAPASSLTVTIGKADVVYTIPTLIE